MQSDMGPLALVRMTYTHKRWGSLFVAVTINAVVASPLILLPSYNQILRCTGGARIWTHIVPDLAQPEPSEGDWSVALWVSEWPSSTKNCSAQFSECPFRMSSFQSPCPFWQRISSVYAYEVSIYMVKSCLRPPIIQSEDNPQSI